VEKTVHVEAGGSLPRRVLKQGTTVMEQIILLSMVTASIAFTISEAVIFKELRERIAIHNDWTGKLVNCGYCLGHWVSFGLVAIYRPRLFTAWWPLDYFLTALVIAWLAGFQWALMCWLMEKAGK